MGGAEIIGNFFGRESGDFDFTKRTCRDSQWRDRTERKRSSLH